VQHLRPALVLIALFTLLTGVAYPLAMTGIAQLAFPAQANGSLITNGGKIIGSSLIGQAFANNRYFHARPSAAGDKGYDASSSSGSNLGPITKKLIDRVKGDVDALRKEGVADPIPVDAVTTSGSGLDPDVSPETALMQAARVAKARGLPEEKVQRLIVAHVHGREFGVLGEPHVNVLELNLALDGATS
jgi:potassium-transporting ATPase KdpC subunit